MLEECEMFAQAHVVEPKCGPPRPSKETTQSSQGTRWCETEVGEEETFPPGVSDVYSSERPIRLKNIVKNLREAELKLVLADKEGGFVVLPTSTYNEKAEEAISGNFRELANVKPLKVYIDAAARDKKVLLLNAMVVEDRYLRAVEDEPQPGVDRSTPEDAQDACKAGLVQLDAIFDPQPDPACLLAKFKALRQGPDESAIQFIQEIRRLARLCDFYAASDVLAFDQIASSSSRRHQRQRPQYAHHTGAVVSLMSVQDYKKFFSNTKLLRSKLAIQNCSEQVISILGYFNASVCYNGNFASVQFYVMGKGMSLLGLDAIRALKIIIVGENPKGVHSASRRRFLPMHRWSPNGLALRTRVK
ncbi:hypothetical protein MTO96_032641 [Rhipicephalus appendiculatus]